MAPHPHTAHPGIQPPDRREVCVGLFFNALSVCTRGQQVNNNNKPPGVRACTCTALFTSFPDIPLGPSSAHAWGGSCTSGASSAVCFRKSNPRMAGELVSWLPVAVRLHCTPVELDHRLFVAQNGSPPAGKSKVRGQGAGRREVYLRNGRSHRSPGCCDTAAKRSSSPERLPLTYIDIPRTRWLDDHSSPLWRSNYPPLLGGGEWYMASKRPELSTQSRY